MCCGPCWCVPVHAVLARSATFSVCKHARIYTCLVRLPLCGSRIHWLAPSSTAPGEANDCMEPRAKQLHWNACAWPKCVRTYVRSTLTFGGAPGLQIVEWSLYQPRRTETPWYGGEALIADIFTRNSNINTTAVPLLSRIEYPIDCALRCGENYELNSYCFL